MTVKVVNMEKRVAVVCRDPIEINTYDPRKGAMCNQLSGRRTCNVEVSYLSSVIEEMRWTVVVLLG